MVRKLTAFALGLIVAVIVMMSVEALGYRLFPLPGFDEAQPANPAAIPTGVLVFILLAWSLGVAIGAYVAVRMSKVPWPAWLIAAAIVAAACFRFALAAHPTWMIAAGIALPILAAWLGLRVAARSG